MGCRAVRTEGIGLCLLLVEGGSLICGSGKAGIPDGKSDRQLLAKKESYIKVRQVMGLDNAPRSILGITENSEDCEGGSGGFGRSA